MKLKEYLKVNKLTQNKFIEEMEKSTGYKMSQGGLSKYLIDIRTPKPSHMKYIRDFTKSFGEGKVEPNDFYSES